MCMCVTVCVRVNSLWKKISSSRENKFAGEYVVCTIVTIYNMYMDMHYIYTIHMHNRLEFVLRVYPTCHDNMNKWKRMLDVKLSTDYSARQLCRVSA
jgi:hypothetical protein